MKIKLDGVEVDLDTKNLEIDEVNLNDFLKDFAGTYNYFNQCWVKAQYLQHLSEDRYDTVFCERFQWYKENDGGSDKLVEAKVKMSDVVIKARKSSRDAKYISQLLFTYLRALDKAHENALNLGYNIRKEMDKLFPKSIKTNDPEVDAQIAAMFK